MVTAAKRVSVAEGRANRPTLCYTGDAMDTLTITIDENGDAITLHPDGADMFRKMGIVVTRRASHVEPYEFWPRLAFTLLRMVSSDDSKMAAWTRTWKCWWRVNATPVGGPILTWADFWWATGMTEDLPVVEQLSFYHDVRAWSSRQAAIDAEILFLNKFFLEGQ